MLFTVFMTTFKVHIFFTIFLLIWVIFGSLSKDFRNRCSQVLSDRKFSSIAYRAYDSCSVSLFRTFHSKYNFTRFEKKIKKKKITKLERRQSQQKWKYRKIRVFAAIMPRRIL